MTGAAAPTPQALAEAQRVGYAEADPSDDVSGRDAAAKMAILARLAFGSPVHLDEVRFEGIEQISRQTTCEYARELDLAPQADRNRRAARWRPVRSRPSRRSSIAGHPLARPSPGPFNAVTVESEAITEITMSGPGAGGLQTASAVLGDVVSVMTGGARPPAPPLGAAPDRGRGKRFLHPPRRRRPPRRAGGSVTQVLGEHDVSIKSVRAARRRTSMQGWSWSPTRSLESGLRSAVERYYGAFDFMRSAPQDHPRHRRGVPMSEGLPRQMYEKR